MIWTPHGTVATVIEKDGKFLLVKEYDNGQAVYNQPAGHIEADELVVDAAIRETLEETAYHVDVNKLIGIYIYKAPANGVTYHRYCFSASVTRFDESAQLDEGIIEAVWLSYEEIQEKVDEMRSPLVIKCIEDYLNKPHLELDTIYELL